MIGKMTLCMIMLVGLSSTTRTVSGDIMMTTSEMSTTKRSHLVFFFSFPSFYLVNFLSNSLFDSSHGH